MKKSPTDNPNEDIFAIVGELVLISSALDHLLNKVLITVLDLGDALLLESVVATLDPARKVEILKARAKHITKREWHHRITKFCDTADNLFKQRNIACHTPPFQENGAWILIPIATAKMLKGMDLSAKTVRHPSLDEFKAAIATGQSALEAAQNLIENFKRVNAEARRRGISKLTSQQATP